MGSGLKPLVNFEPYAALKRRSSALLPAVVITAKSEARTTSEATDKSVRSTRAKSKFPSCPPAFCGPAVEILENIWRDDLDFD